MGGPGFQRRLKESRETEGESRGDHGVREWVGAEALFGRLYKAHFPSEERTKNGIFFQKPVVVDSWWVSGLCLIFYF